MYLSKTDKQLNKLWFSNEEFICFKTYLIGPRLDGVGMVPVILHPLVHGVEPWVVPYELMTFLAYKSYECISQSAYFTSVVGKVLLISQIDLICAPALYRIHLHYNRV